MASSLRASMASTASVRPASSVVCRPFSSSRVAQRVVCQATAAAEKLAPPPPSVGAAPSTYAIVEIGGHQMFVEPGKWYTCNRLKAEPGSKIRLGRVLAVKKDGKLTVGEPYLSNVNVEADVLEELRGPKVIVYKMQPKKHFRKKQGHRQDLSKFKVTTLEVSA